MTRCHFCLLLLIGLHGLVIHINAATVSTTLSDDQMQGQSLKDIKQNVVTTSKTAPAPAPNNALDQAQDTSALNSEQTQRDMIKHVMKSEVSDSCSARADGLAPDDQPLGQICDTLDLMKGTLTSQGCTSADYDKIHNAVCGNVSSSDSDSTVKPPTTAASPTTASPTAAAPPKTSPPIASSITTPPTTAPATKASPTTTTTTLLTTAQPTAAKTTTTTPKPTPSSSTTTPKATTAPTTKSPATPNRGQTSTGITTAKKVTDQGLNDPTIKTNGASVSATLNDNHTQGNNLKELIENLITDDKCTQFIEQLTLVDCSTLTGNRATILGFCKEEDYNKLHAAICNNTPTPTSARSSSPSSTTTTTLKTTAAAPGTSAPNQGQNTPAPNSEQAQRDKIKEVIENELSSDRCKTLVAAQSSDDTPLDKACKQLEGFKAVVTVVGCTQDDYDKLHAAICDYVSEQAQRDKIKEVIENQLSSDRCKDLVQAQSSDDTPLDKACEQLVSFKNIVTLVGCTQDDYDKLNAVICGYVGSSDSKSTVKPSITTASPTKAPITTSNQGVPANDDKQRDVIKCVIENELSSEQCKTAVELQVDENMDLQAGCSLLESLHPSVSAVGCTEDDYTKLHQAICDYGKTCNGAKVKGFNLKKWQDFVLSVIDNQLTQECATLPKGQATEDATPEKACEMFKLGRTALEDMCTENELQLLNEALCEYKNNTDKRVLDETKVVIDTKLTSSCKTTISRQANVFSSDVNQSCTIVSQTGPGLIDSQQCTQADIDSLNNTVCYGDSSCDPPTGVCYSGEEIVKQSPRESRVRTVIGKLTGQCKSVMATGISQLSQEPEDACQTLEATRRNLIDGNVCTELDFVKLKQVVCMDVALGTEVGTEDEIRDNALSIMQNDLTKSCHDIVWPQAAQFAGSLVKGCDLLQTAGATLVASGICTQEDYDKLEDAVCSAGKPAPVYDEKERAQREHIEDVITHNVAEGCRTTMLPQIEAQRDKPLPESCEKLNKNKNVILNGGVCTEDDFDKIHKAVCESGGSGSAATTTASSLALGFCLLLRLL